jgi:acyl-CoA synthetase (AMP-forming)/AMP-acid ligase II
VDEDGFIYIVDRKKDMIISGGVNIYPREVEDVVVAHASVREVAVIGVPSDKWGEEVVAVIVPGAEGAAAQDLDAHARSVLAGYKIPKRYEFVDVLPRNAAGKVLKRELREKFSAT